MTGNSVAVILQRYHQNRRKRLCHQIAPGSRTKGVSVDRKTMGSPCKPRTWRGQFRPLLKTRFMQQYQVVGWRRGGDSNPRYGCAQPQKCCTYLSLPVDCLGSIVRQPYHQNRRKRLWPIIAVGNRTKGVSAGHRMIGDLCKSRISRAQYPRHTKTLFIKQFQIVSWRSKRDSNCQYGRPRNPRKCGRNFNSRAFGDMIFQLHFQSLRRTHTTISDLFATSYFRMKWR